MKKIWVYVEEVQGEISKVSLELLGKARELAVAYHDDVEIGAVLLTGEIGNLVEWLASYGANRVYAAEDERLATYCHTTYGPVLAKLIEKEDPDIFLFGATQTGSELAPTVAAIVKTGVAAHCVAMRINENGLLVADVPAFGGKIIGEILIPKTRPQMASVKPGIFIAKEKCEGQAVLEQINLEVLDKIERRLTLRGTYVTTPSTKPIEEAEVVVAGGYGLCSMENWEKLKELAELLGGSVGATRPCVDEGWAEDEQIMIGTSGKSIRPKVYLGFGISGAAHHTCGMKDAGLIISVNKDERAVMMNMSDYYAVSDLCEMLPILIDKVKAAKSVQ
jgi:electron transfer flavoprotein alpha subunit